MIGLGTLSKLAKGGLGLDELAELLSGMGMDVEFTNLTPDAAGVECITLEHSTGIPGARSISLSGKMGGGTLRALLVLSPSRELPKCDARHIASPPL